MNPNLYTKSVEQLMVEGKISIYYQLQFNEEKQKSESSWGAYSAKSFKTNGHGDTPREAIIDLYKKLSS